MYLKNPSEHGRKWSLIKAGSRVKKWILAAFTITIIQGAVNPTDDTKIYYNN